MGSDQDLAVNLLRPSKERPSTGVSPGYGAHPRDVQAMAGHAPLSTTQRYMPLLVGDLREALAGRDYLAG